MNPNDITFQLVETSARKFLSSYHSSMSLPIPIEEIAEIHMNIGIQLVPGIKNLLGIDAFISANFTQITIDEFSYTKYPQRTRFSIAHEIGHKILHTDWYTNHGPKNIDEALTFQEKLDDITYTRIESQANVFAGLILVPTKLLKEEVRRIVGPKRIFPLIPPPPMSELIERFDVSGEALLRRMQREKILQDFSIPF